ncbi:uncharacterized protein LOC107429460 [Ziziphus jujuba]|uniref:Uncharacterized protein LOC107429460 n=2 Tax=Ziziphus jujuba TaxID=326968 RepID=A0A6P4B9U5_ZIZJJ|nr:uncharacterized protein LOC107429460 [Ziziphus jujuba]KAH7516509.1 hypothetical protein FEM48_Zijuj10G0142700 [Ziziphus jujuba var. spinosa]
MVCVGEEEGVPNYMAKGPERSRPLLHNFDLPCLKWGTQRQLRCMKVNSIGAFEGVAADDDDHQQYMGFRVETTPISRRRESEPERRRFRVPKPKTADSNDSEEGIEALREKLMSDLKTAANKLKDAILRDEVVAEGGDADNDTEAVVEGSPAPATTAVDLRPWNLRTRRVACKSSNGGGGKGLRTEERKPNNNSPLRSDGGNNGGKSPRPVRGLPEKKDRPKFSVPLARKEIEEDFMEMLGNRPPRRPKKRPRMVQKQLDCLFPGLWLTEVTADSYKVPEFPENCKR